MGTQPLYDSPRVGGDVLAYCTRCKMELAHVVVSMAEIKAARVQCKTCKSQHNFKRQSIITTQRTNSKKVAPPRTVVKISEYWQKKLGESKQVEAKPYRADSKFIKGDVIQHPSFGIGFVEDLRGHGKIVVIFQDSEKVLIHEMVVEASP